MTDLEADLVIAKAEIEKLFSDNGDDVMNDKVRLIDANALLDKQTEAEGYGGWIAQVVLVEDIENAPEVDAVPVVRCGDCRYRELAKVNCKGYVICPASGMEITDDDYCSYGERRK